MTACRMPYGIGGRRCVEVQTIVFYQPRESRLQTNGTLKTVLGVAVALLTICVPIHVAYELHNRGPEPEKSLQSQRWLQVNPMSDLSALGDRVRLSLRIDGQTMDHLVIASAFLENVGDAPILPDDYHQNLSVSVTYPWRIVAVENSQPGLGKVKLKWNRISITRFEAEPALLNPGDIVDTTVYLTSQSNSQAAGANELPKPHVRWGTRITNLKGIRDAPDFFERMVEKRWGITINLSGWSVPFTIAGALVSLALYLVLLDQAGLINQWGWKSIAIVLFAALLSFAAAEAMATYLFGNISTEIVGVDHTLNAPPIVAHAVAVSVLWWKTRGSARKRKCYQRSVRM